MSKFPLHAHTTEPLVTTAVGQAKALWPFLVGIGVTGYIFFKVALSVTDEDVKKSKFANPNQKHH
eukprot:jgi/Botrbrau1/18915/Bobra.177_2s0070.1